MKMKKEGMKMKKESMAKQAKPDFPDIDGDGNTKESMKKAAADKKSPAKQTSSDIRKAVKKQDKANKKIDKNNAKVKAYNNKLKEIKTFIANNTTGAVGDSTNLRVPSTIEGAVTMEKYEKMNKQLEKLRKKIK